MNSAQNAPLPDIVLVQPPNPVLRDPTTRWPLGLAYLEAVLLKEGVKVSVADLRAKPAVHLSDIPLAEMYGITATTGEIGYAKEIAGLVRHRDRKVFTVIGGAHATYLTDDCKGYFDAVVSGEGENQIASLVDSGTHLDYDLRDLDSLPFPSRHPFSFSNALFEGAGYGRGPKATSLITSRGCPFACAFCRTSAGVVRFRSAANVAEEIEQLIKDWDCWYYRFEDDSFTLRPERVFELCRLLEPLHVHFRMHTRSDLFTADMAKALKAAGCEEAGFGVESGDQRVLEIINKKETVEEHIKAIRICEDAGIKAKAFLMTSLPGETWETIEYIKKFMLRARPSKWIASKFCPYPGSDIYAQPEKYGVKWLDRDFSHYWNFSNTAMVEYESVSKQELDEHYLKLFSWLSKEFPR